MKLILAEKPSVAKTIATFLGARTRHDGYFEGNDYIMELNTTLPFAIDFSADL